MTPGYGKPRSELPWLPYEEQDRVIINAHNFTPAIWTPAQISTSLWLDASDAATLFDAVSGGSPVAADGAVARWQDKSGNDRHATQSASGSRGLRKTSIQNSLDVVRLDGTNDFFNLVLTLFRNKSHACAFFVIRESSASSRPLIYASRGDSANFTRSSCYSGTGAAAQVTGGRRLDTDSFRSTGTAAGSSGCVSVLGSWDYSGNVVSQMRNGVVVGSTNTWSSGAGTSQDSDSVVTYLGYDTSLYSPHDICEVIIGDSWSTETRQRVEGYAHHRWGIASLLDALHPYKSAAP
jgi:hypothetical protein